MDGIMIAFLPAPTYLFEQARTEFPHLTLVYAGKLEDSSPSEISALTKDAASVARLISVFTLPVMGLDVFGSEDEKVKVVTLHPSPQLISARMLVEGWNKSEYTEYKPHVTLGPEATDVRELPASIYFDRLSVNWGDKSLVIPLSNGY